MALTDVPLATQTLAATQNTIRQNFLGINSGFAVDHQTLNPGAGSPGKHNKVTMPEQAGDQVTAVNEMALYVKQSAISGVAALFLRDENNGAVIELSTADGAANGWARLPSGILIKWGISAAPGVAGLRTVTFPVAATTPVFATILTVLASASSADIVDSNFAVRVVDWQVLSFRAFVSSRTAAGAATGGFTYLAIGT